MKRTCVGLVSVTVVALLLVPSLALAATAPSLGTAANFAVLGASTVTNTGGTTVTGDLGVSPGTAITGFPPGLITGTRHSADSVALQAQNDVTTAYNVLAGNPCDAFLTGQDLGGRTLTPGVYCFSSSAQLTGTLTLDGGSSVNPAFIFKIGSTLTTASNSRVLVINGGTNCNVWWQVGSSATLGTTTGFVGNILAHISITLNTGAGISGRALASTGAVTLDTNNVNASAAACGAPPPPAPPGPPPTVEGLSCPPIGGLTVNGTPAIETVTLSSPAPSGGTVVTLASSASGTASVPVSILVPAGTTTATFAVTPGATAGTATITASIGESESSEICAVTVAAAALSPVGGPTLDSLGLTILVLLLAVAGAFLVNRLSL